MKRFGVAAVAVLLLGLAGPAGAQEVQVPLDEAGRVEVVDAGLARAAGLWVTEYPGFREARLFRAPDRSFVLELTEERDGRLLRHRQALSPEEVAELRRRIGETVAGMPRGPGRPAFSQEGRAVLLGQSTAAGALFYGWALPYAIGAKDETAAGLYFLTAGASFFLPYVLTEDQPVTRGMADLSRYGITRGAVHGLLIGEILVGDDQVETICDETGCYSETTGGGGRIRAGAAVLTSVAEGVAGYLWARGEQMDRGTAQAVSLGGDAGLLGGLGTAVLLDLHDDRDFRIGSALGLAGSAAGLYTGHRLAGRRGYTHGDVGVMNTAMGLGAWSGIALANTVADDEKLAVGAAMLGGAGGLILSDRMVDRTALTAGQARLVGLGTVAGLLAGASLGVMAENEDLASIGSALGGMVGFGLTFDSVARRGPEMGRDLGFDLRVHPAGLLDGLRGAPPSSRGSELLSVRYRF